MLCTIENCGRPHRSRGLCNAHYFRQYRNGTTNANAPIRVEAQRCRVAGCARKHAGFGYCTTHLRRVRKGGHPDYVPSRLGPNNPAWRGDRIGYVRAHERVAEARGPARDQLCSCGAAAKHWSYKHDDPHELKTATGIAYSPNPKHYVALCVPCHKREDLRRLRATPK